jgi:hypothetical protein
MVAHEIRIRSTTIFSRISKSDDFFDGYAQWGVLDLPDGLLRQIGFEIEDKRTMVINNFKLCDQRPQR